MLPHGETEDVVPGAPSSTFGGVASAGRAGDEGAAAALIPGGVGASTGVAAVLSAGNGSNGCAVFSARSSIGEGSVPLETGASVAPVAPKAGWEVAGGDAGGAAMDWAGGGSGAWLKDGAFEAVTAAVVGCFGGCGAAGCGAGGSGAVWEAGAAEGFGPDGAGPAAAARAEAGSESLLRRLRAGSSRDDRVLSRRSSISSALGTPRLRFGLAAAGGAASASALALSLSGKKPDKVSSSLRSMSEWSALALRLRESLTCASASTSANTSPKISSEVSWPLWAAAPGFGVGKKSSTILSSSSSEKGLGSTRSAWY